MAWLRKFKKAIDVDVSNGATASITDLKVKGRAETSNFSEIVKKDTATATAITDSPRRSAIDKKGEPPGKTGEPPGKTGEAPGKTGESPAGDAASSKPGKLRKLFSYTPEGKNNYYYNPDGSVKCSSIAPGMVH